MHASGVRSFGIRGKLAFWVMSAGGKDDCIKDAVDPLPEQRVFRPGNTAEPVSNRRPTCHRVVRGQRPLMRVASPGAAACAGILTGDALTLDEVERARIWGHFKKRNATYAKANSVHLSLS